MVGNKSEILRCLGDASVINKQIAIVDAEQIITMDAPFTTDYLEYYGKNMIGVGEMIVYSENGKHHTAKIEGINDLGELLKLREPSKSVCVRVK